MTSGVGGVCYNDSILDKPPPIWLSMLPNLLCDLFVSVVERALFNLGWVGDMPRMESDSFSGFDTFFVIYGIFSSRIASTIAGSFSRLLGKNPRFDKSMISLRSSGSSVFLVYIAWSNFYLFKCFGRVILLIFALFWKSSEKMISSMLARFSGLRCKHYLIIMLKSFVTPCGIGLYFWEQTFSSSSSIFAAS